MKSAAAVMGVDRQQELEHCIRSLDHRLAIRADNYAALASEIKRAAEEYLRPYTQSTTRIYASSPPHC